LTADERHWEKTLEVSLQGYFFAARAAAETMARRGGGKILNIASISAQRPLPGLGVYSVTKAAVTTLTRVLAAELATRNIQVNALAPGLIKTRFSRALWGDEDYARRAIERIPAGRVGEVEDLIDAALYFAGKASDYTAGAVLAVDGGYSIGP
jgi:NAD(P)-dependent dehydrogenase (short-subunit alcohol dehydrogenase family)